MISLIQVIRLKDRPSGVQNFYIIQEKDFMEITKKRRMIEIVVGVAAIVIFGFLYYSVYQAYYNETYNRLANIEGTVPGTADYIDSTAKVLMVDPIKGEMTVRISFIPNGVYATEDGSLTRELSLYVNSATGGENRSFAKGKDMSPIDVTLNMDGMVTDYPFDSHEAYLELLFNEVVKDGDPVYVPMVLNFSGSVSGLKISAENDTQSDESYKLINIHVARSQTTLAIIISAMVLLWLVTLTVLFMFLSVVLRGRKIEFGMFAFMSGFLFSFVAFRNAMPGAPPIGTLSDYLAFFWGYAIIALSLVGLTMNWLVKPPK
jgi:hypothetical protein